MPIENASPGKENRPSHKNSISPSKKEVLLSQPQSFDELIENTRKLKELVAKLDLQNNNGKSQPFDALGAAGPTVRHLKGYLTAAYIFLKENDTSVAKGSLSSLAGLQKASDCSRTAEQLIKMCSIVMQKIETACAVTAFYEELSTPLADFLDYMPKLKLHKFSTADLVDTSCQLMKKMQDVSSGPHDSALLASSERFVMACLNSHMLKLRQAAVAMWNKTFGNSNSLEYSEKLRQVLIATSKKASIFMPGLSVDLMTTEEAKTSTTPQHKQRSAKKRVAALIDDDSVDYVPIVQQTDSAKKMKLTDHQKEIFSAAREKLPYMDEDSMQFKADVLSHIGSQYDIDTSSQSASTSQHQAKLAAKEKAVFKSPVEQEAKVAVEEKKTEEVLPKKRGRPSLASKKAKEELKEKESKVEEPIVKRRSARRCLNMPPSTEAKKEDVEEKSEPEVVLLSSGSEVTESESSQDSTSVVAAGGGSRGRQRKGTPSKFVPKKRLQQASKTPVQQKEATAQAPVVTGSDDDDDSFMELINKAKKSLAKDKVSVVKEPTTPTNTPQTSVGEGQGAADSIAPVAPVLDEASLRTPPKKLQDAEADVLPGSASTRATPGILKKPGTPSTLERRRMRVHFPQDVAMREEERNAMVATPKRGGRIDSFLLKNSPKRLAEGSTESTSTLPSSGPLFPGLVNDKEPITKIINQLTPVRTPTAATVLQKHLSLKKITTVGDLASSNEAVISTLPVKLPTVRCVLQEYANSTKKEPSPVPEQTAYSQPEVACPSAADQVDDPMETTELKQLELWEAKSIDADDESIDLGPEEPWETVESLELIPANDEEVQASGEKVEEKPAAEPEKVEKEEEPKDQMNFEKIHEDLLAMTTLISSSETKLANLTDPSPAQMKTLLSAYNQLTAAVTSFQGRLFNKF